MKDFPRPPGADLFDLRPDVIAHVPPSEGRDWHPVAILLKRGDANKLSVGLMLALRHVPIPAETRRVIAELALALDVRLVAVPNQAGTQDLKAQGRAERWRRLYDGMTDDLNQASARFGEEPGSRYDSNGKLREPQD